ncbi:hypothetical protein [uncultured Oscillibacter sp.]|uniref:hypothetical protein n=1 Tax=uncultured Oscillibacter sp. TaxID=876091 RepID=UPI0026051CB8|nr:hypothetical protein [uncultured Oscillibacter sp.]
MTYLESLSFYDAARLLFYVFSFGAIVRYGFRFADWFLKVCKDFFSCFKKDRP